MYVVATYRILQLLRLKIYFNSSLNTASFFCACLKYGLTVCTRFPVDRKIGWVQQEKCSLQQLYVQPEYCFYDLS